MSYIFALLEALHLSVEGEQNLNASVFLFYRNVLFYRTDYS